MLSRAASQGPMASTPPPNNPPTSHVSGLAQHFEKRSGGKAEGKTAALNTTATAAVSESSEVDDEEGEDPESEHQAGPATTAGATEVENQ